MIEIDCEQGSPAWHEARAGVITASMFATCMSRVKTGKNKGGFSAAATDYAFRIAIERIGGGPISDEQYQTAAMRRGQELEAVARDIHAFQIGEDIRQVGIVLTDDLRFGASPDGLIGTDAGVEYKCFTDPAKLRSIIVDGDLSGVEAQCQGGMWITGRTRWHFVLYCPALASVGRDLTTYVIERDDEYIEQMEQSLREFDALVDSYIDILRGHTK